MVLVDIGEKEMKIQVGVEGNMVTHAVPYGWGADLPKGGTISLVNNGAEVGQIPVDQLTKINAFQKEVITLYALKVLGSYEKPVMLGDYHWKGKHDDTEYALSKIKTPSFNQFVDIMHPVLEKAITGIDPRDNVFHDEENPSPDQKILHSIAKSAGRPAYEIFGGEGCFGHPPFEKQLQQLKSHNYNFNPKKFVALQPRYEGMRSMARDIPGSLEWALEARAELKPGDTWTEALDSVVNRPMTPEEVEIASGKAHTDAAVALEFKERFGIDLKNPSLTKDALAAIKKSGAKYRDKDALSPEQQSAAQEDMRVVLDVLGADNSQKGAALSRKELRQLNEVAENYGLQVTEGKGHGVTISGKGLTIER
jgi:hypothetical protein